MKSLLAVTAALASLFTSSQALYFYLDGTTPKCFYEDLPKDTLVVGKFLPVPFTLLICKSFRVNTTPTRSSAFFLYMQTNTGENLQAHTNQRRTTRKRNHTT